jgi:AAA+ superfamily predicted ATPase
MNKLLSQLDSAVRYRIETEFNLPSTVQSTGFNLENEGPSTPLTAFILENELTDDDITWLMLALAPHVQPEFITRVISEYLPNGGEFPEFGGTKAKNHRGMIPTGETGLYILAGTNTTERIARKKFIDTESELFARRILRIDDVPAGEPKMSGTLLIDDEYIDLLTTGQIVKPKMTANFPAQLIETSLEWDDLILNDSTLKQIREIETWLKYHETVMNEWNMKHVFKPGYRVMFYGPPGTGKTLTAGLLGKYTNRDVYRIDLSMVVSKYIGETEKNLSLLFDKATNKDWILFFDEADAIFGKRTNVRDAHDKYANQEVSYLLQRIEAHPGLVILASNFKSNIDSAFTRRFQTIIEFELPAYEERLKLWRNNLPQGIGLATDVDLHALSKRYDITGANIVNIIQYACLQTLEHSHDEIRLEHLVSGIKKEYVKEGKMM